MKETWSVILGYASNDEILKHKKISKSFLEHKINFPRFYRKVVQCIRTVTGCHHLSYKLTVSLTEVVVRYRLPNTCPVITCHNPSELLPSLFDTRSFFVRQPMTDCGYWTWLGSKFFLCQGNLLAASLLNVCAIFFLKELFLHFSWLNVMCAELIYRYIKQNHNVRPFCRPTKKAKILLAYKNVKASFHFGEFVRATKLWAIWAYVAWNATWKLAFTGGQFWKLNQVQLFRDQNERQPIRSLLFNARACQRTGSCDQIHQSGNQP